jgi:ADP-dependent NAD(P)H-hydrate dehydratase / NAD(P)H-hydrate epimerase
MKLLNAEQTRAWDAYTIQQQGITSLQLMERAAAKCAAYITEHYAGRAVKIFCGKGNNGGDGLAIARLLLLQDFTVDIYIIELGAKGSADFQANLQLLQQANVPVHFIQQEEYFPAVGTDDIVIDALLGSGLNRPPEGLFAALIQYLNHHAQYIIAIDVPSGLFMDKATTGTAVIKATETLTFQSLKTAFLLSENAVYTGHVKVLDIELASSFTLDIETTYELTCANDITPLIKQRNKFSHKGSFGHALLVAGSKGKMGAAVLAAHGCLRSGVGLLTCLVPEAGIDIMQISEPHAMAITAMEEIAIERLAVIGIGPGLGTDDTAKALVDKAIQQQKPMVIDADALNIISNHIALLEQLPAQTILTPHPKEFERLFGKSNSDFERMEKAVQLSAKYPFVIVLKGAYTLVASKGKGYFNTTGNSGLATGGSGDILTGILTGLLAQKYPAETAAKTGIYLHGLAADLALAQQSEESLLPADVVAHLGKAFKQL